MGTVTIIYASGDEDSSAATSLSLDMMQKAVGGYIEVVPLFRKYDGEKCVALCDEEGKLKRKQVNIKATQLWHDQLGPRAAMDVLVGDILIVRGKDLLAKL